MMGADTDWSALSSATSMPSMVLYVTSSSDSRTENGVEERRPVDASEHTTHGSGPLPALTARCCERRPRNRSSDHPETTV